MSRGKKFFLIVILIVGTLWLAAAAVAVFDGFSKTGSLFGPRQVLHGETYAFGSPRPILLKTLGDPATSGLKDWPGSFDSQPSAYDFDGDGVQEIVALSNDTNIYVFDPETGRALAVLPMTIPDGWYVERILNSAALGVMAPGEPPSIVVADHAAFLTRWDYAADESDADHFTFHRAWERRLNDCFGKPSMDATAVLGDLDGDGSQEIVVQTEEIGIYAVYANGTNKWKLCWGGGNGTPNIADTDGDGRPEVVFASDQGLLSVVDGRTGKAKWTFNARQNGVYPAAISVTPTVAELDGTPPKEVLFTARNVPSGDAEHFKDYHMGIYAVHQSTTTWQSEALWFRTPDWANPLSYTRLIVDDVDADGRQDVFGMDWNTVGHHPGNWENLGKGHLFRLDDQGNDVWVEDFDSWWSNKDIALHDLYRDGHQDVLANGENVGADGIWRVNAETGAKKGFLSVFPWKVDRSPLTTDLEQDGTLEAAISCTSDEPGLDRGAVLLFELGPVS